MSSPFGLVAENVSVNVVLGTCIDCFKKFQTSELIHRLVLRCGLFRLLRWRQAQSPVPFAKEHSIIKDVLLQILAAFEAAQMHSSNSESENTDPSSSRESMADKLLVHNIIELARQIDHDAGLADGPAPENLETGSLEPLLSLAHAVNRVEQVTSKISNDANLIEGSESKKISTTYLERLMSVDNIVSHMDQLASERFIGVSLIPTRTQQMFCDESEFEHLIGRIAMLLEELERLLPQPEVLCKLVEEDIDQIRAKPSLELLETAAEHIDPLLRAAAKEALDSQRYQPIFPSRWNVDSSTTGRDERLTGPKDDETSPSREPIKNPRRTADELSVYTSLTSKRHGIRILEILPGVFGTRITAKFIESHITDTSYEALSYTWGDGIAGPSIQLNGKTFRVTENLERCLQHLRYKDRSRLLWVDALCINQEDIKEQNHQVRLMGNIYSSAVGVVVWLDTDIDLNEPAFTKLLHVTDLSSLGKNGTFWTPVVDLFTHPYWNRLWIQQELALCKRYEVNCRGSIIPGHCVSDFLFHTRLIAVMEQFREQYKNFRLLANYVESGTDVPSRNLEAFQRHVAQKSSMKFRVSEFRSRLVWRMKQCNRNDMVAEDCRILRCLMDFQNTLQVSKPLDRVFGILALTTDCSTKDIKIDYGRSVADVYEDSLYHIYHRYGSLDFLCAVEISRENHHNPHDLPSWVPDWDRPLYSSFFKVWKNYRASGGLVPPSNPFSKNGRTLRVQGLKIGSVLKSVRWERERKPIARHVVAWNNIMGAAKESLGVQDAMTWFAEQLRQVMAADSLGVASMCQKDQVVMDIVMFCLTAMLPPYMGMEFCEFVPSQEICNLRPVYQSIYHYMEGILSRRELFLSDKGWLGLVSEGTVQEGDEVWILFGCSMPILLRPHDTYHTVVAPVAAPGVMNGEAVKDIGHFNREGRAYGQYIVRSIELR